MPIGWIGRQVDDVEAHGGDRGQPLGGGAEGAGDRRRRRLGDPAPSERGKNSYQEPNSARSRSTCSGIGGSEVTSSRSGWRVSAAVDLGGQRGGEPGGGGPALVAQRVDGGQHARPGRRFFGTPGGGPLVAAAAPSSRTSVGVDPGRDLDPRRGAARWRPGRSTPPPCTSSGPRAVGVTSAPQRSVPGASSRIGVQGPGRPRGSREHDVGVDRVVALAEDGGGDLEGLADHGLGRPAAAVDRAGGRPGRECDRS